MNAEQKAAVALFRKISEGFDIGGTPFTVGLCYAADQLGADRPYYTNYESNNSPTAKRIHFFAPNDSMFWCFDESLTTHPFDRSAHELRATVAALIAAMIETGDDPANE